MTLMLGGTFTETQIATFLNSFQANWFDPGEGIDFVDGIYNGEDIWTVDALGSDDDPGVSVAVVTGSTVILIGPTADVKACIDTIKTAGDADSMFENDNIRGIMGDFGNPVLMAVIDGNVPLPEGGGGDGPTLPESVAITAGIAMEKTGDTMRVQAILEVGEMGDWLALLTAAIPTTGEFETIMEENRLRDERREEYWHVQNAVNNMMWDNWIPDGQLPNPVTATATNDMSAFPDTTSAAGTSAKEWDHNGDPYTTNDGDGYLLDQHDGMATDDATDLWTYINDMEETEYFYTCESNGFVRQWSDAAKTEEYTESYLIEDNEERVRNDEYWRVQEAVQSLMDDSNVWSLGGLPHPVSPVTTATNDMSAFPDATSVAGSADKIDDGRGGTYTANDRNGYTVYDHDGQGNDDSADLWSYIGELPTTQYYYACDTDGFVHQYTDAAMTEETTPSRDW
ncbi:hypothetical protein ACFLXN_03190 [Chloroflexota bacterium]